MPASHAGNAAAVARTSSKQRGLPSLSGSFTTGGVTYPYTMLGAAPSSGRTVALRTVVVPLTMKFVGFDQDVTLRPDRALSNILRSDIDLFDAQLHAILPKLHLKADETPLFITDSVTADALGYHDAFLVPDGKGGQRVQTLMWTSWLDIAQVGPLLADVSTLNHEVAEWLDDPFINNEAPLWAFPPFNTSCGDNPFVEVGDAQGNGPDFDLFPTVEIPLRGFTYHLQDIATLQWFSREVPSSAQNGWYDFPATNQLTSPSVDCPAAP